jgi:uncharacterized membrane protein
MFDTTSAQAGRIRKGLAITTLGGLLFTLDLPLLRLSMADQWTMVFARGIFLFLSISFVWLAIRQVTGNKLRYLAGTTGLIVAGVSTLANITYIGAIVNTNAANVVFVIALIPVITAMLSRIFIKERTHPRHSCRELVRGHSRTDIRLLHRDCPHHHQGERQECRDQFCHRQPVFGHYRAAVFQGRPGFPAEYIVLRHAGTVLDRAQRPVGHSPGVDPDCQWPALPALRRCEHVLPPGDRSDPHLDLAAVC